VAAVRRTACICLIFAAATACSAAQNADKSSALAALGMACASDEACQTGYCDLGVCAAPQGLYGSPCREAPRTSAGVRDAKLNTCGAYICADGKCRSCTSAVQCQREYGAPYCRANDVRPGQRCGAL